MAKVEDLTFGVDIRGDYALFVERKHFIDPYDGIDDELKKKIGFETIFFRVIADGKQTRSHGWFDRGEIMQWG